MKIAILAPPYLPVPPPLYGGTEKIVSLLTEGLVERGHDVTLFASGDSQTKAKLVSLFPEALGNSGLTKDDKDKPLAHYHECYRRASEFDIIHSHGQYLSLAEAEGLKTPVVFTWHGSFYPGETPEEKRDILKKYKHLNYISISNNQRGGLPELNFVATVYNALDIGEYPFVAGPAVRLTGAEVGISSFSRRQGPARDSIVLDEGVKAVTALETKHLPAPSFPTVGSDDVYLLWVGRMSPKKGALDAITASKRLGIRLEMAAAIDPIDHPYFESEIKPHIDGKNVIYHGEIGHDALVELYGGAIATLYPISWHEPFGLVMAESMACGTPVVAYNIGSVPEIVVDGKTGFIVEDIHGLVSAVKRIGTIDRAACRKHVEEHFHKDRMVEDYLAVYKKLASLAPPAERS